MTMLFIWIAVNMANTTIANVLQKLHLETAQPNFAPDKSTQDSRKTVGKLSIAEFQMLGISNSFDKLKLKTESDKYGSWTLVKVSLQCGAPDFDSLRSSIEWTHLPLRLYNVNHWQSS